MRLLLAANNQATRRNEIIKSYLQPGSSSNRYAPRMPQHFFFGSAPVAFRRVALETPEWTSRDSNHHRQSVSAGKTNAIPTEPSDCLPRLPQQETKSSTKQPAPTDPIPGPENLLKTGFAQKGLPSSTLLLPYGRAPSLVACLRTV